MLRVDGVMGVTATHTLCCQRSTRLQRRGSAGSLPLVAGPDGDQLHGRRACFKV